MRKIILFVFVFCLGSITYAQINNSKEQKIKTLLELTGSGKIGVSVMKSMIESFKTSMPKVDEAVWNEFQKEIDAEELVRLVIPIYDKYYSENDIDELIKFYKTPIGNKMISVLPSLMKESMETGRAWGEKIGEKAIVKLKEKGLIKN